MYNFLNCLDEKKEFESILMLFTYMRTYIAFKTLYKN